MRTTLIVYFSKTGEQLVNKKLISLKIGNTAKLANYVSKFVNADIVKLELLNEYPHGFIETCKISKIELAKNVNVKLITKIRNIDQYKKIFIGYPIWWESYPMAIKTFLKSYNFDNKIIIPFCTHEGSGLCYTDKRMQELLPNTKVMKGIAIKGSDVSTCRQTVCNWIKENDY